MTSPRRTTGVVIVESGPNFSHAEPTLYVLVTDAGSSSVALL